MDRAWPRGHCPMAQTAQARLNGGPDANCFEWVWPAARRERQIAGLAGSQAFLGGKPARMSERESFSELARASRCARERLARQSARSCRRSARTCRNIARGCRKLARTCRGTARKSPNTARRCGGNARSCGKCARICGRENLSHTDSRARTGRYDLDRGNLLVTEAAFVFWQRLIFGLGREWEY